ncbi:hypothetical protein SBBP1_130002 [Burkholderiales bacterium]|nr:hypothetical protein SBBP1_130002 [Burkholderiales bacterium]
MRYPLSKERHYERLRRTDVHIVQCGYEKIFAFHMTIMRLIDAKRKPMDPRYLVVKALPAPIPSREKIFRAEASQSARGTLTVLLY